MRRNLRNCFQSRIAASVVAAVSAIGMLIHTPFDPKKLGRISRNGTRKINCRVSDRKMALGARSEERR